MNILSFFTHEGWESNWAKTGHNFFMLSSPERKEGWKSRERKMPDNYTHVSFDEARMLCNREIDVVVNHSAFEQRLVAQKLCRESNIQRIEMNHCLPLKAWSASDIVGLKQTNDTDFNVFTTRYQADCWGYNLSGFVCGHTVDTDLFKNDYSGIISRSMSVAYDFKERADVLGYKDWEFLTNGISHIHHGNEDFAVLATAKDLSEAYCLNRAFVNTAKRSTLPTSLLEAMACGMPVVTVRAEAYTDDIFLDGENGFVSEDLFELKEKLEILLTNMDLAAKIGMNGYNTFCDKFSPFSFVSKWNEIFNHARNSK